MNLKGDSIPEPPEKSAAQATSSLASETLGREPSCLYLGF
jgi:hypothetical protein